MVEKIVLDESEGEKNLLEAIIAELARKFRSRERLPFSGISHFREFARQDNTIAV